jgi:hypothetical protein
MAAIIQPQPWTRQPQIPVGINKASPFAKNAQHLYLFSAGINWNAAGIPYTTTALNGPTQQIVNGSRGLAFDGSNDVVYTSGIPYSPAFTWAGRVIVGTTISTAPYASIASRHTSNGVASDWYIYRSSSDSKLHVDIPWVAGDVMVSTNTYSTGVPLSIMLTRSGSAGAWTWRLYVNGVLDKEQASASNPAGTADEYVLSASNKVWNNTANNQYEYAYLANAELPAAAAMQLHVNPWQLFAPLPRRIFVGPSAGGGAYTLTADAGIYTLSGQAATLTKSKLLTADAGSYSIAGQTATLSWSSPGTYTLTADAGSYTMSGQTATLLKSNVLTASAGAYSLSGQDATLTKAAAAAYTLTANAGSYILQGQSAVLTNSGEVITTPAPTEPNSIDWGALVAKTWGKDYVKPEWDYEFSNGRRFLEKKNPYA